MRAEDRGACGADPLEHLRENAARGVREVEDHAERDEAVDELTAEPRQASALFGGPVGERVPAVPRQPGHADAEGMEDIRGPRLHAEALHALEGEQEPDALAGLDRVEVGGGRHLHHAVGVLPQRVVERRDHRQRLAQRALRLHAHVDVDGAHLEADSAALEEREPGIREDLRLAEPALAVGELHQEVDVGVGDHRPPTLCHNPRRRAGRMDLHRHQTEGER